MTLVASDDAMVARTELAHLAGIVEGGRIMASSGATGLDLRLYLRDTIIPVLRALAESEVKLVRRFG